MFASIFLSQYFELDPPESMRRKRFQFRPCQKSPSQNTATRLLTSTISGFPGSPRVCTRYLVPRLQSALRNKSSGRVSFLGVRLFAMELAIVAGLHPRNDGAR